MNSPDVVESIQAAAQILLDTVLRELQADPHQWSDRPCPTCRTITAIVSKPFGCYEYQRLKRQRESGEKGQ